MTDAAVHPPPTRRSTWSTRQKLARVLWATIARPVWVLAPAVRPRLLRWFGARVGAGCRFARDVDIAIPWTLEIGDGVVVADRVILYALGPVSIGDRTRLDVRAHLCAGTHDMNDSRFPLLRSSISIGADCVIGLDAYIGPEVRLGDGVIVEPRASVFRGFAGPGRLAGTPAAAVAEVSPVTPPAEVPA